MKRNFFTKGAVVRYKNDRGEFIGMVITNPIEDSLIASSYHELNLVQLYSEKHRASDVEITGANFQGKWARVDHFFTVKPIDVFELIGFVMKPDQVKIIAEVIKFILRGYSKYEYKEVFDTIEESLPTTSWDVHYIEQTSVALEDADDEASETTDGSDLGATNAVTKGDTTESESVVSNDSEDIDIGIALKSIREDGLNKYCHVNGLEDHDKRFGFIVKLSDLTRPKTSKYHVVFKEMQYHFFAPQYCWSNIDDITRTVKPKKQRIRQSWKTIEDIRSIMDAITEHGLTYFMLTHGISNDVKSRAIFIRKINKAVNELGNESDKLRVMDLKMNPEAFRIPFDSTKPKTEETPNAVANDTKEVKEEKTERKIPLKTWGILGKCPLDLGIITGWYEAKPSNVFDGFAIKYADNPYMIYDSDSWFIYIDEETEFNENEFTTVNGMHIPFNQMVHVQNGVITETLKPSEFYAVPSIGGDDGKMALMAGYGRYIPTMSKSWSRKETSVVLTVCKALGTKEVFETGILRASSIPIMMDKIHRESERYGFRKRYEEIASRLSAKMRKKIKKTSRR
jgi:hypothetical protein